ncbi:N-acetylornithine carbamoyltransferase [Aliikangiella coralliicola]|uniref:N-acetylornithine carbamoyltransferase n=1 Tax=Aliikangiella coralliicola TaxID=2592383 RepID=A0A545UA81_9GAMM|nr:N-acetylornithine carbamoyltransferase [Aliikangiella coralliicola]TQV86370.1 N-acetylornithine carbamoyltransferase [Aliikangiella coralliicola]
MKHYITTADWDQAALQEMLDLANEFKQGATSECLKNKSVALLFFNPSLRTRTSFELGTWQMGGHAIVLEPGKSAWPLEFEIGSQMDDVAEEHVIEAAKVLSRYCDLICIRAFPKFVDWQEDKQDKMINAFAKYATVPVINMETITHPCQELAHMQTIQEKLGNPKKKKYLLTWTYHPKPLNTAVANSSLLIASKFGMDVTLLCPNENYLLDDHYMTLAQKNADQYGGSFQVTHNIEEAYAGAEIVYAKSWGALPYFGNWEPEKTIRDQYKHFIVDENKMAMTNNALFSHCLPLRRNIKATDAVMDADYCVAIDEAENRLHVQKAIMSQLINQ